MERFIRRFKNKYFALSFVTVLFSIICLTSYGVFIISTSKYRASEMYLGNLIYQINLESLTPTTATISGKDVNLTAANATSTIFMNVRSLNPVRSRYNVEYKVKTGAAIVKYSNVTPWKPNGLLDSTDEIVFEKKIKITIINTSSSPATVSLDVAGGYAYTNDADVKTISGFTKFINDNPSNMYDGSSAKSVKVLSSRVKNDTSCTPTIDTPCLYGGETQRNYVSYSNEVYRIIGLYLIDNVETVKLIKDTNYRTPSTYTDSQNTLHTWKNDLFLPIDYVRESSPFCSSDVLSCTTPLQSYGLITKKEYERVGAHYSFINKGADFLTGTLNGNNVYYVKSDGSISQIASSTQSNLKPVFYLQDGVKAKNTGTESNPYELSFRGDIFVHSITIDGVASPSTPTTGSYAMQSQCTCDDEVCSDATDIQWNNTTHTIDYVMGPGTPTLYCNFSFLKGDVIFSSIIVNGKKASSTPLESGYTMTSTCTGGSAVWDDVNHKVITQVISGPLVCDLEFTKPLAVSLTAYGGTLSSNNLVIAKNSSATASLTPTTGFVSLGTGVKCSTGITGSVSGNTITINTTNQNSGTCDIVASKVFDYTGSQQEYTMPIAGTYKLQVWGAQGGYRSSTSYGGLGGYASGTINAPASLKTYVFVGGSGNTGSTNGGFNGGGARQSYPGGGGGTDIRIASSSLYARVIVAGGGGSDGNSSKNGMYGGGTDGGSSTQNYGSGGYGGTQTGNSWFVASHPTSLTSSDGAYASFGYGGNGITYANGYGGSGGGGWYGGSGAYPDGSGDDDRGGGGGSGYVYTSSTAGNYPSGCLLNTSHYLTNASTIAGNTSFTNTTGGSETGHTGNGYAIISFLP